MSEFYDTLDQYDIIIKGKEMGELHSRILTYKATELIKKGYINKRCFSLCL